ncbi:hypothetical protein M0804_001213 [Polistes exclamans]|nr:hypothetical protein M0804_001213 [Polistes exclamans]
MESAKGSQESQIERDGLKHKGKKKELLQAARKKKLRQNDDDDDSEDEEAESSKDEVPTKAMQMLTFKDVEESLQAFSSDSTLSVKCWMREFEEMAELKKALLNEFVEVTSAYKVHELLRKRTKEPGESYQEYIYTMCEITAQAGLDKASTIQYIVSGVQDEHLIKRSYTERQRLTN